jgi:hypothetical protein
MTVTVEIDPADLRAFQRARMVPNACIGALARALARLPSDEAPPGEERVRPEQIKPGIQGALEMETT